MTDPERPLEIVVRVQATNGTTLLEGLEHLCQQLRECRLPKPGVVAERFWRVTVLDLSADRQELRELER